MKKLLLFLVALLGMSFSVAPVQERVAPRISPVVAAVLEPLGPRARAVLDPLFRWSVKNEARLVARELRELELSGQRLPTPAEFAAFMEERDDSDRKGRDPWGQPYYLRVTDDSIIVSSAGPDRTPATPDDVQAVMSRR